MPIIRHVNPLHERFTMLPNALLRDDRLSFRARGILALLLSFSEGFRVTSQTLAAMSPGEGRDAVRTALNELDAAGYLRRPRMQGPDGLWRVEWHLYADGDADTLTPPGVIHSPPGPDIQASVEPASVGPAIREGLEKEEPPSSSGGPPPPAPEAGASPADDDDETEIQETLSGLPVGATAPVRRQVRAALAAGWTPAALNEHLAGLVGPNARKPAAVVLAGLAALPEPPRPKVSPWDRSTWCGECDEHNRWLDADGDNPRKCPTCHPSRLAAVS